MRWGLRLGHHTKVRRLANTLHILLQWTMCSALNYMDDRVRETSPF